MLRMIRKISRKESIDNIQDATVLTRNLNGSYNIRLRSGAIKRGVVNMTNETFLPNDVVNISMVSGHRETAKIIGRSLKKKGEQKIHYV
jgi:hypothetical protein